MGLWIHQIKNELLLMRKLAQSQLTSVVHPKMRDPSEEEEGETRD